jgi:hypothetical protein
LRGKRDLVHTALEEPLSGTIDRVLKRGQTGKLPAAARGIRSGQPSNGSGKPVADSSIITMRANLERFGGVNRHNLGVAIRGMQTGANRAPIDQFHGIARLKSGNQADAHADRESGLPDVETPRRNTKSRERGLGFRKICS